MPEIVDYGEWKNSVGELERILDEEDGKFDPKSDIEKEYSNLEKLADETKVGFQYNSVYVLIVFVNIQQYEKKE